MSVKIEVADRVKRLPKSYIFAEVAKRKRAAANAGLDIIDFGIGDPDFGAPPAVVAAITKNLQDKANHRYPDTEGTREYREAWAILYERDFGVKLDPEKQVHHLIGGKEGIGNFPNAFVNPGDIVICPDPAYPVYDEGTILAEGEPYYLPLRAENNFIADFREIPEEIARRAKIFWSNYPNNPTGATADLDYFTNLARWAQRYNVIVCSDNTYSHINSFGSPTPSFLRAPGAMEVGVEFHSVSKTFSFTGARCGVVIGNADIIAGLHRIKSTLDSGGSDFVQLGVAAHLLGCSDYVTEINSIYTERRVAFQKVLADLGFGSFDSNATFYVWDKNPAGWSSEELAYGLIEQTGVVLIPGNGLGRTQGEGYIRGSVACAGLESIEKAGTRIKKFLAKRRK